MPDKDKVKSIHLVFNDGDELLKHVDIFATESTKKSKDNTPGRPQSVDHQVDRAMFTVDYAAKNGANPTLDEAISDLLKAAEKSLERRPAS